MKAKRAVIQIAGIDIDAFQKDGEYFLSQSQVAEVVEMHKYSTTRFIEELRKNEDYTGHKNEGVNDFKALPSKHYTGHILEVEANGKGKRGSSRVIAIPPKLASLFWSYQARKGNDRALALVCACVEEALERRLDKAFELVKTEEVYDRRLAANFQQMCSKLSWDEIRGLTESVHGMFQGWCNGNCANAGIIHNRITKAVCGKTAAELREGELVTGNSKIGLNHIEDKQVLMMVAQVKLKISSYRTGTVDQRIERAIKDITV